MKLAFPRLLGGNRGDLLSRFGILAALRRLGYEDAEVFCDHDRDVAPLACATYRPGRLHNLIPSLAGLRALWKSEVVVWSGGLDLQDDSSLLKLLHTWLTFLSYRLLGCRIVMMMQGAGPLTTRPGRWLARRVLNLAECFVARDSGTLRLVEGLRVRTRLVRGHDGIFLPGLESAAVSPAEDEAVRRYLGEPGACKVVGLNLRLWFHFGNSIVPYQFARRRYLERAGAAMDRVVDAAVMLVRRLRQGGVRVVLLSMYEPGTSVWEDDLPYLARVKAAFVGDPEVVLVEEHLGLGGVCRLVKGFDLMVGTRLHSTLTALRMGVPAINLAYTNKCQDIFGDLGLSANIVGLEAFMADPDAAARLAFGLLEDPKVRPALRRLIAQRIEENLGVLRESLQPSAPVARGKAA